MQGVFFRAWTRRKAQGLGLTGHAINLDDGAVDVLGCGDADQLDQLEVWLRKGPPAAKVTRVTAQPIDQAMPPVEFTTG